MSHTCVQTARSYSFKKSLNYVRDPLQVRVNMIFYLISEYIKIIRP